jgi:hypothetical protein
MESRIQEAIKYIERYPEAPVARVALNFIYRATDSGIA